MKDRIIDRDIAFYNAAIEAHIRDMRNCTPIEELKHEQLRDAATAVRNAMLAYRTLMD